MSADASEPQLSVRFTTQLEALRVTDAPIQIPTRLTRAGLSEVVNHLLAATDGAHVTNNEMASVVRLQRWAIVSATVVLTHPRTTALLAHASPAYSGEESDAATAVWGNVDGPIEWARA